MEPLAVMREQLADAFRLPSPIVVVAGSYVLVSVSGPKMIE